MKFNFKKIATVLGSALMVGSTMGLAAAANYPQPFVTSGAGDVAVVIGANSLDMAYATTITSDLSGKITVASSTGVSGGDSVKLERGSNKFNYGDALNTHYTSLDNDEFSVVLADGVYLNDDNTEYKYEQKITPANETIQFFHDSSYKDDVPMMGFNFDRSDLVFNYTLTFTPTKADGSAAVSGDEYPKIDNTNIDILGKTYFISDAEFTTNGIQLSLLDAANTETIAEGETKTMTVGDKTYTVQIDFVEDSNTAKLIINGEATNSVDEGQTYKLSDGTYVGIKDVSYNAKDSGISKVEFSLGAGKVVLEQGQEVKLNDDDVSELEDANEYSSVIKTYFTNSTATTIDTITLQWQVNTETWVAPGTELVMPGFNAIKLSMTAWNAPKQETTLIDDNGDSVRITTQVKDGELKLPILYANSSVHGFDGIGEDATHKLVTNASVDPTFKLNETENSYFVVTWISGDEAETYAYEIGSITSNSGKNTTKLTNMVSGGADIEFDTTGDTEDVGQITLTLQANVSDSNGIAFIKAGGAQTYGNLITTAEGMTIRLPVASTDGSTDGNINVSSTTNPDPTTHDINFTEEDKEGNIHTGATTSLKSFVATVGFVAAEGTEPTGTSLTEVQEADDSDYYVAYVESDLGTKVRLYNPSSSNTLNKLEIIYAGEESYADVYIAETSATTGSAAALQPVYDTAVSSVSSKNLIVIGGSCINTVAAKLLGSNTPMCGASFTTASGVGAGQFIIKSFDATAAGGTAGKVALLVAGYDAADTEKAATYLKERTVNTAIGTVVKKTSATYADIA